MKTCAKLGESHKQTLIEKICPIGPYHVNLKSGLMSFLIRPSLEDKKQHAPKKTIQK